MPTLNFPSPDVANPGDKVHTGDVTWVFTDKGFWSSEVGEAGGGASVHYGPTAPDSPSQGDLWYADDSTVEFGGRLYIYTGTEWVDTSLPGGGSGDSGGAEVGSLQTVTDNGAVTTNVCEFQGGVYLPSGAITADGNLSIKPGGPSASPVANFTGRLNVRTSNSLIIPQNGLIDSSVTITGTQTSLGSDSHPCGIRSEIRTDDQFDGAGSDLICAYQTRVRADGTGNALAGSYVHYYAPSQRASDPVTTGGLYGFRSRILASDATNAFNFYAGGDAPNYFAGLTEHEGGVDVTGGSADTAKIYGSGMALELGKNNASANFNSDVVYIGPTLTGTGKVKLLTVNLANTNTTGCTAFKVLDAPATSNSVLGFESGIDTGSGTGRYNFHASGSAPNYFKGGVQFATATGTDALDRYEEGVFEAKFDTTININYTNDYGKYTIVGDVCTATFFLSWDFLNNSSSDRIRLKLPFKAKYPQAEYRSGASLGYCKGFSFSNQMIITVSGQGNGAGIFDLNNNGTGISALTYSACDQNDGELQTTFIYHVE